VLGPSEGGLGGQDAPDGFPASGRNAYPSGANAFFADVPTPIWIQIRRWMPTPSPSPHFPKPNTMPHPTCTAPPQPPPFVPLLFFRSTRQWKRSKTCHSRDFVRASSGRETKTIIQLMATFTPTKTIERILSRMKTEAQPRLNPSVVKISMEIDQINPKTNETMFLSMEN